MPLGYLWRNKILFLSVCSKNWTLKIRTWEINQGLWQETNPSWHLKTKLKSTGEVDMSSSPRLGLPRTQETAWMFENQWVSKSQMKKRSLLIRKMPRFTNEKNSVNSNKMTRKSFLHALLRCRELLSKRPPVTIGSLPFLTLNRWI